MPSKSRRTKFVEFIKQLELFITRYEKLVRLLDDNTTDV